jgi:hypothetical protein
MILFGRRDGHQGLQQTAIRTDPEADVVADDAYPRAFPASRSGKTS